MSTSLTLVPPATVHAGDAMVAHVAVRPAVQITPPPGWDLLDAASNDDLRHALYGRVASASEPVTAGYTWTFSAAASACGAIACWAGTDVAPFVAVRTRLSGRQSAPTTSHLAPEIPQPTHRAVIVTCYSMAGGLTLTLPPTRTARYHTAGAVTILGADALSTIPEIVAPVTVTSAPASYGCATHLVVHARARRAAPVSGQPTVPSGPPPATIEVAATAGVVVELPAALSGGIPRLAVFALGSGATYAGAVVGLSRDGVSYVEIGTTGPGHVGGQLATILEAVEYPAQAMLDATVEVDTSPSGGILPSTTRAGLWAGVCTVVVGVTPSQETPVTAESDVEWMAYQDAILLAQHRYRLRGLRRALYDSSGGRRGAGTWMVRVTPQALLVPLTVADLGTPLWFRFRSRGTGGVAAGPATYVRVVPRGLALLPAPISGLQVVAAGVRLGGIRRI